MRQVRLPKGHDSLTFISNLLITETYPIGIANINISVESKRGLNTTLSDTFEIEEYPDSLVLRSEMGREGKKRRYRWKP